METPSLGHHLPVHRLGTIRSEDIEGLTCRGQMHILGDMREETWFLEAQWQPQHEVLELGGHCPKGEVERRGAPTPQHAQISQAESLPGNIPVAWKIRGLLLIESLPNTGED